MQNLPSFLGMVFRSIEWSRGKTVHTVQPRGFMLVLLYAWPNLLFPTSMEPTHNCGTDAYVRIEQERTQRHQTTWPTYKHKKAKQSRQPYSTLPYWYMSSSSTARRWGPLSTGASLDVWIYVYEHINAFFRPLFRLVVEHQNDSRA